MHAGILKGVVESCRLALIPEGAHCPAQAALDSTPTFNHQLPSMKPICYMSEELEAMMSRWALRICNTYTRTPADFSEGFIKLYSCGRRTRGSAWILKRGCLCG